MLGHVEHVGWVTEVGGGSEEVVDAKRRGNAEEDRSSAFLANGLLSVEGVVSAEAVRGKERGGVAETVLRPRRAIV